MNLRNKNFFAPFAFFAVKNYWLVLIPLLLLTFWLGARGLDMDSIWADEYLSIFDAGGATLGWISPLEVPARLGERNPWHAPAYFVMLNLWSRLVGWDPAVLRALALLLGILAVAMTYRLAYDVGSPRAGLFAGVMLGTAAFFIYYLHEIRMYALIALLTATIVWLYLRVIDPQRAPTRLEWAGLFAGAALIPYTHYLSALPLGAVGLYHLLFVRKDRRWWAVAGVLLLAALCFLPWMRVLLTGLGYAEESELLQTEALGNDAVLRSLIYQFSNGNLPLLALIGVGAAAAFIKARRGARRMWFFAFVTLGAILAINAVLPLILSTRIRYLISLWPLLVSVGAIGLAHVWQAHRWGRYAALALLGVWMVYGAVNHSNAQFTANLSGSGFLFPMHVLSRQLRGQTQFDDVVFSYIPDADVESSRYRRPALFYLKNLSVNYYVFREGVAENKLTTLSEALAELTDDQQRVWVAAMPGQQASGLDALHAALNGDYTLCRVAVSRPNLQVELLTRSPACCDATDAVPLLRFTLSEGSAIDLMRADIPVTTLGGDLPLVLSWRAAGIIPIHEYSVGLHVLNAQGEKVAQADYGLPPQAATCRRTVVTLGDLPPGEYRLMATVYNWRTGARLTGSIVASGEAGDLLPVGTFTNG